MNRICEHCKEAPAMKWPVLHTGVAYRLCVDCCESVRRLVDKLDESSDMETGCCWAGRAPMLDELDGQGAGAEA